MDKLLFRVAVLSALLTSTSAATAKESVEVLHWWTSGSEATALKLLKNNLAKEGIDWKDVPVAGGGGGSAMTVLRARVTAGDAPTAVQMLGFDVTDWAKEGVLANLDAVAIKGDWDKLVPAAIQKFSKYDGHWIAVPVNVHSTNWVWGNKKIMDELGISQPKTWNAFVAALKKVKDAGKIALAHGGQPWQEATMFDGVALSVGGVDFYRKALIQLDPKALGGEQMVETFKRMTTLRGFVDDNFSGRDWNLASAMVINDQAAFQIMGDWAKGEFLKAGKKPDVDFVCFRMPGSQGMVTFNSDQFAMFDVAKDKQHAQFEMAKAVISPSFQSAFNVVKGSVPARLDVADSAFDNCGKKAMKQLAAANTNGTLLGSMAHGHAAPAAIKNAMYDVITAEFNGEMTPEEAAKEMVSAVKNAQ